MTRNYNKSEVWDSINNERPKPQVDRLPAQFKKCEGCRNAIAIVDGCKLVCAQLVDKVSSVMWCSAKVEDGHGRR